MPGPFRLDGVNEWLGQGDVFVGMSPEETPGEAQDIGEHATLVLDHECQVAKPRSGHVLCTCVFPVAFLNVGDQGHVRANKVRHTMYLAEVPGWTEAFADFRYIFRARKERLQQLVELGARAASMSEEGRLALQEHVYRHFARRLHEADGEVGQ